MELIQIKKKILFKTQKKKVILLATLIVQDKICPMRKRNGQIQSKKEKSHVIYIFHIFFFCDEKQQFLCFKIIFKISKFNCMQHITLTSQLYGVRLRLWEGIQSPSTAVIYVFYYNYSINEFEFEIIHINFPLETRFVKKLVKKKICSKHSRHLVSKFSSIQVRYKFLFLENFIKF